MSEVETQLRQAAEAFLAPFKDLSVNDILAIRAPNCTHQFAPASLNPPPPLSNEQFAAHITDNFHPVMNHCPITAKEVQVNTASRQVTIWATSKPGFKAAAMDDKENWDHTGEYVFLLDYDEVGKLVRIVEFLDSLATERLRGLIVVARKNIGLGGEAW